MISYTEGLKKKCADPDLNAVLYTNRAAAQYYLGNLSHCWVLSEELTYDKAIMMASGVWEYQEKELLIPDTSGCLF